MRRRQHGRRKSKDEPQGIVLSAGLTEDLTAQKTAAIGMELVHQPDIALAAVVHALVLGSLYYGRIRSKAASTFASMHRRCTAP